VTPRRRLIAVFLLATTAGCAGLTGPTRGGQVEANVVSSAPAGADPTPLSEVDDERLRRVTERAVTAYESNGTAEIVVVPVPGPELDETEAAYERLSQRSDGELGRFVTYRGYTVRVVLLVYS